MIDFSDIRMTREVSPYRSTVWDGGPIEYCWKAATDPTHMYCAYGAWLIDAEKLDTAPIAEYVTASYREGLGSKTFTRDVIIELPHYDCSVKIHVDQKGEHSSLGFQFISSSNEGIDSAKAWLMTCYPKQEIKDGHVSLSFMNVGNYGIEFNDKKIKADSWDSIRVNYDPNIYASLDKVMAAKSEKDLGSSLVIWRGVPGTGKTYAIRSLLWEWHEWCDLRYVIDADAFFKKPKYMMEYLLEHTNLEKPSLLIFEDAGEMLSRDAKFRDSQGIASFLNVIDGLIGQGSRLIMLVTTNEEMKSLHPAVVRDGRAGSIVDFKAFDIDETMKWLVDHGYEGNMAEHVKGSKTLSEMYALLKQGHTMKEEMIHEPTFGFAA